MSGAGVVGGDPFTEVARLLDSHGVRYVLVGVRGAWLHGFDVPTRDADVLPADDAENLRRLNDALRHANAELGGGVSVPADSGWLERRAAAAEAHESVAVPASTDAGQIDVVLRASGVPSYEDWRPRAEERLVAGVRVLVGSLEDIIASKEAAGRQKDAEHLPTLRALLAARERGEPVITSSDAEEVIGRRRPTGDLPRVTWDWAADAVVRYRREQGVAEGHGLGPLPDEPEALAEYQKVLARVAESRVGLGYLDRVLSPGHPSEAEASDREGPEL